MVWAIAPLLIIVALVLCLWRISWHGYVAACRIAGYLFRRLPGSALATGAGALHASLGRRLPRTMRFLANRLDPTHFDGLPMSLLVLGAVYAAALLGGLVEEVMEADEIVAFDHAANAFLDRFRTPAAVAAFAWITTLGGSGTLAAVALVATGFLWAYRHGHLAAPLWINFIGALATTYTGKFAFARQRPEFLTDVTALTPSFPSGHATGAMAVYGFVAYLISRDLPTARQRFEMTYWTLVLIGLISFSRIFLSVHFVSDVAAGLLVGTFWLLVGFTIAEQIRQRRKRPG